MKKTYEIPTLEELGSFEAMTMAAVTGTATDIAEPANTPFGDLTFS